MRIKCNNFKNISIGCLFAPAAYIFCAYISIYCTFADKWSYREFTCATRGVSESSYSEPQITGKLNTGEMANDSALRVDKSVTGVAAITNGTQEFHTIYMPSSYKLLTERQKLNKLQSQETGDTSSTETSEPHDSDFLTVTFWFGLFHVCRHDIGKCYVYSFPETSHLKAMFIAATYILLVISICPIIINKMNISTKSSNVIQLPLLLIHSCLIVYVMSAYGAYARKHDHVISWTYHVTATLIGLPWIVWYWHTIETGKERSRLAESQSSTSVITSSGYEYSTQNHMLLPVRRIELPSYEEAIASKNNSANNILMNTHFSEVERNQLKYFSDLDVSSSNNRTSAQSTDLIPPNPYNLQGTSLPEVIPETPPPQYRQSFRGASASQRDNTTTNDNLSPNMAYSGSRSVTLGSSSTTSEHSDLSTMIGEYWC